MSSRNYDEIPLTLRKLTIIKVVGLEESENS